MCCGPICVNDTDRVNAAWGVYPAPDIRSDARGAGHLPVSARQRTAPPKWRSRSWMPFITHTVRSAACDLSSPKGCLAVGPVKLPHKGRGEDVAVVVARERNSRQGAPVPTTIRLR